MEDLTPLWLVMNLDGSPRYTGTEIARMLGFGEPGSYEKLKPHHVYYYRQKFKLPERAKHYTYGKLGDYDAPEVVRDTMDIEKFKEYIQNIGKDPKSREFYNKRKRAYLIIVFWSGLRKSEIYELTREEFEITDDGLTLETVRKKKQEDKVIPLFLPRTMWGIDEAIQWIERFEKTTRRPFEISSTTAWKYVKELAKELYPHWFRSNIVTDMSNDPEMTAGVMRSWFGFSYATIEKYLGAQQRLQKREAEKRARAS